MVVDSIIEFCKKELTIKGEIKKYYKLWLYLIPTIYLIVYIPLLYFIGTTPYMVILSLVLFFLMILAKSILIRKTIKKMNPNYVTKLSWDRLAVRKEFYKRLEKHIKKEGIEDKEKLLIKLLNKRAQKLKTPYLLSISIFSALFTVVFNGYVSKIYDIIGNDFESTTVIFLVFIVLIVATVYFCDSIKDVYLSFLTDYSYIQRLIDLLEDRQISR